MRARIFHDRYLLRSQGMVGRIISGLWRRWRFWTTNLAGRLGRYDRWKIVDWTKVQRLVFVCSGNICRSPYAEYLANREGILAISCGTTAKGGMPADPTAVLVASQQGIDLEGHCSMRFEDLEISSEDLIIAMDLGHLADITSAVSEHGAQLTLLGLWDGMHPIVIQDPFGQPAEKFQFCFTRIQKCIDGLVRARNEAKVWSASQFRG